MMAWLRIDDAFADHPKIVALGSPDRRWTWMRILVYSCKHRTAIIPSGIADVISKATVSYLRDCVRIGLIDVDEHGTMRIHDWDEYQAGDPKKAARQARWRNRVDAPVDADVDAGVDDDVDVNVDEHVDASRVGARARTRPVPIDVFTPAAIVHNAAAAKTLSNAGWSDRQIPTHPDELDRALAWLAHSQDDPTSTNPSALAWTKFKASGWPDPPRTEIAVGASGTRSTSPPLPQREPEPDYEPAPPPAELKQLLGVTPSPTESPEKPAKRRRRATKPKPA